MLVERERQRRGTFHTGRVHWNELGAALQLWTTLITTCVDAPLGAREIFESGVARGRVLTCVRPLLRRVPCRRPRWESEDQVQVRPTRLKRLSQSWFS